MRFSATLLSLLAAALAVSGCARKRNTGNRQAAAAAAPAPAAPPASAPRHLQNQGVNLPAGSLPPGTKVSYSSVPVNGPYISITFDDGPEPRNTPRLLDMLKARNIKATFFVVGNRTGTWPAVTRRIVAEGHEIANHTWSHRLLSSLGDSAVREELSRCHDAIVKLTGAAPRMYRPPGGAITQRQKEWIMSEFGYPTIMWTVDPQDWRRPGPAVVTSRILANTRPGAIILVHDLHAQSVDAMPATLDGLLARGYRFVTTSQLITLGQRQGTTAPVASLHSPGSH